jgi:anti-sigma-K factor RskA/putative zinc finger protein
MNTTCGECRTLLGGYVLHALEPDEAEVVRRHLADCAACAAEHGQLMAVPAMLDFADAEERPVVEPPPALEEAVLDRFAREHRGAHIHRPSLLERMRRPLRHLSRPLPAALAGAAAAAAVTAALLVLPGSGDEDGRVYQAKLTGSTAAPGATAWADLKVQDGAGTRVKLTVRGLKGDPASVYELWCLRDDGAKVSAGTFRTDGDGWAEVDLTTAAVPGEYHRLSIERKGFTPATEAGERVMTGDIQYPHS